MSNPHSVERAPRFALRNRRIAVGALAVAAVALTLAGVVGGALEAPRTAVETPSVPDAPGTGASGVQTLYSAHTTVQASLPESPPPSF